MMSLFQSSRMNARSQYSLYASLLNRVQVRNFAQVSASQVDDEDSIPENFREDRTLNIAKNTPGLKDDPVISELLNNQQNMTTLDNFYNSNQKTMNLVQHSFLLYRVN